MLIPLIVACALFMENLNSTVLATSLPAIAHDFGESPVRLSFAITSYLFSLAVFIPISGWVADRFGAKHVFRGAILVFLGGSILCGLSDSLWQLVAARMLQGMGGAMMVPVGRLVLLRSVAKAEMVGAMAWLTVPALIGPVIGPAARRLHHDLFPLALDLLDQRADRDSGPGPGDPVHSRSARSRARRASTRPALP